MKQYLQSGFPLYPFLFAIFPAFYLWNANRGQQPAYVLIPVIGISMLIVAVLFLFALLFTRNSHRAAFLVFLVTFFVTTYGHLTNLAGQLLQGVLVPYMLPITVGALLVGLGVAYRRGTGGPNLSKLLNVVTAALVLFQVVSATPYFWRKTGLSSAIAHASAQAELIPQTANIPEELPDVYFILVDNYGRQDILLNSVYYDNSRFLRYLSNHDFYFPDCAQGNYFWTAPAISSILNMQYLDELGVPEDSYSKRGHYDNLAPFIEDSLVIEKFRAYGYHVVTFRGFMGLIDIQNTDTYISFDNDPAYDRTIATGRFVDLFLETTVLGALESTEEPVYEPDEGDLIEMGIRAKEIASSDVLEPQFDDVYQQNLYAFEALKRIPQEIPGPKFVYAHIYSAHWPFMTRPDGTLRLPFSQQITSSGYRDALRFTNNRLAEAVDAILENSETDPIIIIQGDHSNEWVDPVEWSGADRLKILSAYYLPGGGSRLLHDHISPINNFRLIFKHYFGEDIDLLPDLHHYLDPESKQVKLAPPSCMSDIE